MLLLCVGFLCYFYVISDKTFFSLNSMDFPFPSLLNNYKIMLCNRRYAYYNFN